MYPARLALLALAIATCSDSLARELSNSDRRQIANNAIRKQQIIYTLPKFELNRRDKIVILYWPNVDYPSTRDWTSGLLQYEMTITVFKSFYKQQFDRAKWEPSIKRAEAYIDNVAAAVGKYPPFDSEQSYELQGKIHEQLYSILKEPAEAYATKMGFRLEDAVSAPSVAVEIRAGGDAINVYELNIIDWIKYQMQGDNPLKLMNPVTNGESAAWSGTHIVVVEFKGNRRFGPKEISLKESGVLTIAGPTSRPSFKKFKNNP